jgi:hypothetical protein
LVSGAAAEGLFSGDRAPRNAILPWGPLFNSTDRWKGLAADIEKAKASLEKLNETGFRRSPTYPYD